MIKSGLVNQKRAEFPNGYPHQRDANARNDVIRPYVSLGDPIVAKKSDYSSPMTYKAITPSPVDYNDIFGKRATADERLYILRQIQQGFDKIQRGIIGAVPPKSTPPPTPGAVAQMPRIEPIAAPSVGDTPVTDTPAPMPNLMEIDEEFYDAEDGEELLEQEEQAVEVVEPRPSPITEQPYQYADVALSVEFNRQIPYKQAEQGTYSLYNIQQPMSTAESVEDVDFVDYIIDPKNSLRGDLVETFFRLEKRKSQQILNDAWNHVEEMKRKELEDKLNSETKERQAAYMAKYASGLAYLEALHDSYVKLDYNKREELREKYFNDVMYERSIIDKYTEEAYAVFAKAIDNFEKKLGTANIEELINQPEAVRVNGVGPRTRTRTKIKKQPLKKRISSPSKIATFARPAARRRRNPNLRINTNVDRVGPPIQIGKARIEKSMEERIPKVRQQRRRQ